MRWPFASGHVKLRGIDQRPTTQSPGRWRLSLRHLAAALGIFLVEVYIARYLPHGFVRTFVGDVLVVVLLYFTVRGMLSLSSRATILGVFLFACAIELGQAVHLIRLLGLGTIKPQHLTEARIVIGTSYDPLDFAAYALGALLLLLGTQSLRIRSRL